jgi:hypothetical protein
MNKFELLEHYYLYGKNEKRKYYQINQIKQINQINQIKQINLIDFINGNKKINYDMLLPDDFNVSTYKELNCEIAMGLISVKSRSNSTPPCLSDKLNKNIFFDLQIANFPAFTRMAFLTSIFKTRPFPDIKIGEDLIFLLSLNLPKKRIYLSNSEVYINFIGSKDQTTFNYDIDIMYELLLKILESIEKKQFASKRMAIAMLNKIFIRIIKSESKWFLNRNKISTFNRVILINLKNLLQFIVAIVYLTANRPKIIKAIHES